MAYISIELAGKGTFGGYLSVDGDKQIELVNNLLIKVEPGTHHLSFSTLTSGERKMNNLNARLGVATGSATNLAIAAYNERNSVDGEITEDFREDSIMFFTVVSDAAGHVLSQPQYRMDALDDDSMREADMIYLEQRAQVAAQTAEANKGSLTELLLCIFLGSLGVHRFYRKQYVMGIVYLFTMGLFGIGVVVDAIMIVKRMCGK